MQYSDRLDKIRLDNTLLYVRQKLHNYQTKNV